MKILYSAVELVFQSNITRAITLIFLFIEFPILCSKWIHFVEMMMLDTFWHRLLVVVDTPALWCHFQRVIQMWSYGYECDQGLTRRRFDPTALILMLWLPSDPKFCDSKRFSLWSKSKRVTGAMKIVRFHGSLHHHHPSSWCVQ